MTSINCGYFHHSKIICICLNECILIGAGMYNPIQYPCGDTRSSSATNYYVFVRQLSEQITRFALNETLTPQVWPSRHYPWVNSGQILTDRRDEFNLIPTAIWWAYGTPTYKTVITFFRSGRRFKWNAGMVLSRGTCMRGALNGHRIIIYKHTDGSEGRTVSTVVWKLIVNEIADRQSNVCIWSDLC